MTKEKYPGEKQTNQVLAQRGKIISNFAYIENIMNSFIAASYFGESETKQLNLMIEEVFNDKFFSFELRKQVFYKILKNRFRTVYSSFPRAKLERMQEIRNIIAHGLLTARSDIKKPAITGISFKHGGKIHLSSEIIQEYESLWKSVKLKLKDLPGITIQQVFP